MKKVNVGLDTNDKKLLVPSKEQRQEAEENWENAHLVARDEFYTVDDFIHFVEKDRKRKDS